MHNQGGNGDNKPRMREVKLKTARELGDVLATTNQVLEEAEAQEMRAPSPGLPISGDDSTVAGSEAATDLDALKQARAVLEMHGSFKGINRKVQLRVSTYSDDGEPAELLLVIKWGGVLTPLGRQHAEEIGRAFRERLYPGVDGLIRLHSTYRHDLKIYSSDEGRVQATAAAFAKGLLDLEGHLTPILESLV